MKFHLTDKELVYLGWDDPGLTRNDPELSQVVRKIRGKLDLKPEDTEIVKQEIRLAATIFGCDPSDARIAKGLLRKIEKLNS